MSKLISSRGTKSVLLSGLGLSVRVWMFHATNFMVLVFEVFQPHDGEPSGYGFLDGERKMSNWIKYSPFVCWLLTKSFQLSLDCSHHPSLITTRLGNLVLAHRTRHLCVCAFLACSWCYTLGSTQFFINSAIRSNSKETKTIGVEQFVAAVICLHSHWVW